jgi:hypothetical protein
MAFYIGDVPAQPFVIEPPETINLADFTDSEARLIAPDGINTLVDSTLDAGLGSILVDFPTDDSLFTVAGVYRLRIILTALAGYRQALPDVRLVAQDAASQWQTLDTIRDDWPDAEFIADALLWRVLEVSKIECVAFAPKLEDDAPVPLNYFDAQGMQARNRWNARKVAPDGSTGQEDFIIRPFPLDWHVKATLRPKQGIPVLG